MECGTDVRVGDLLLSRDEWNPGGMIVAQRVEEVFVREALILELKVLGRTIRTTAEHPFHRYVDGWVACNRLRVGDRIALEEGWAEVEGLVDTGWWETVYNFRIAEFHTYFVGCDEWGFSVWVHNQYAMTRAEWGGFRREFRDWTSSIGLSGKDKSFIWQQVRQAKQYAGSQGVFRGEVNGIMRAVQRGKENGWTLVRKDFGYGANSRYGVDLVFRQRQGMQTIYHAVEAKGFSSNSWLGRIAINAGIGNEAWTLRRLERAARYGNRDAQALFNKQDKIRNTISYFV